MSLHAPTLLSRPSWLPATLVMALGSASAQEFHEQAKLVASDVAPEAKFGCSVALEGDRAVVGAEQDTHSGWFRAGAAYVLARNGATWSQEAKLVASDGRDRDEFGRSVALAGDTVLAGVPLDDVWHFGSLGVDSGSVRVFVRGGSSWSEQAMLTLASPAGVEYFGTSVALDGDTAVVGVSGDRNLGSRTGSAHVFTRSGTTWSLQARLLAGDGAHGDRFGNAVAISGDTVLVGAVSDGNPNDPSGSAYVFVRTGTSWAEQAKLRPDDGAIGDNFGACVALSGDTAVVGAPLKDLPGAPGTSAGAAYVFTRTGTTWTQQEKLELADAFPADRFGSSVALSGDRALIGAELRDRTGTGSGPAHDDGAAFLLERTGGAWIEVARLTAGDDSRGLGTSVALSGDTFLVGAEDDDHCAGQEGGAYVFALAPGAVHPRLLAVAPTNTPALVPGTAQTISITGVDLDLTTDVFLECQRIDPAHYTIFGSGLITLDMPQAPALGGNLLAVSDGVHTDSISIWVVNLIAPVYELGNGEPMNVVARDDGLHYVVGGPAGSVQYLYASPSSVPSLSRYVNLDLGNGFTQIFSAGSCRIPASGWLEVTVPAAQLPLPGPGGLLLYSQTALRQWHFPWPVSNLQSIVLVP